MKKCQYRFKKATKMIKGISENFAHSSFKANIAHVCLKRLRWAEERFPGVRLLRVVEKLLEVVSGRPTDHHVGADTSLATDFDLEMGRTTSLS